MIWQQKTVKDLRHLQVLVVLQEVLMEMVENLTKEPKRRNNMNPKVLEILDFHKEELYSIMQEIAITSIDKQVITFYTPYGSISFDLR